MKNNYPIKYTVKEGKSPISGKHYVAAQVVPNGTLSFDQVCAEACNGNNVKPAEMKAAVALYMEAVQENLLKGFRVQVGEQFLTVYPRITQGVTDKDGKVAKASDIHASKATKSLGCTVNVLYSNQFRAASKWQKVDDKGMPVAEGEEDITDDAPGSSTPEGGGGSGIELEG